MNKRLKELAMQAETKEIGYYFFDREKFAELIVRECAGLVDGCNNSFPYVSFGDMIKKHFGVKE
jgi:hypothetical protein